jgi:hypothetical protein
LQVAKEPLSQLGTAPQQRQQQQQQQQQQKRDSMGTVAPGQYVPASNPSAAAHNQQQSQLSFSEQQLRHSAGGWCEWCRCCFKRAVLFIALFISDVFGIVTNVCVLNGFFRK